MRLLLGSETSGAERRLPADGRVAGRRLRPPWNVLSVSLAPPSRQCPQQRVIVHPSAPLRPLFARRPHVCVVTLLPGLRDGRGSHASRRDAELGILPAGGLHRGARWHSLPPVCAPAYLSEPPANSVSRAWLPDSTESARCWSPQDNELRRTENCKSQRDRIRRPVTLGGGDF